MHAEAPVLSLHEAAAKALQQNLRLQIQRFEPQIAQEDIRIESSAFDVQLEGETTFSGTRSPDGNYVGHSLNANAGAGVLLPTGTSVSLGTSFDRSSGRTLGGNYLDNGTAYYDGESNDAALTGEIRQPLLQGAWTGVNLARLRKARSAYAAEQLQLRADALDLMLTVTERYWDLSYAYAARDLQESSVEAAQQLVEETEARTDAGLATPIDLLQAKANLADSKEELLQAALAIADSGDALAESMGTLIESQDEAFTPVVSDLPSDTGAVADFQNYWPTILHEDLDTAIQEEAIQQRDLDRLIARDSHKPKVDAVLRGSTKGSDDYSRSGAYDSLADGDGYNWSAGLQFQVPVGRRGSLARMHQADYRLEQAKVQLIEMKQDLYKRARSAWRTVNLGLQREQAAEARVTLQERAMEQARARYDRGLTSFRELLEAQRDLDNARLQRINVLRDLATARATLSRLEGSLIQELNLAADPTISTEALAD